LFHV